MHTELKAAAAVCLKLNLLYSRPTARALTMATTTLLLHTSHHHHHEPHKRQAEEETSSSCDGSDVSSRHPPSPAPALPISDSFNHQNNDHLSVERGDDLRSPSAMNPQRLPRASCSDEEDCCSNNDDEDELLSVGSETPPPIMPITDHLIALSSSRIHLNSENEDDDEDSDAKTEMCSASQSSDSCSRSSISRCSLMTDCYSTSSSITSPVPPTINPAKLVPSSPEDLVHSHPQHRQHSPSLRDNIFSRHIYRPQQQASQLNHSQSAATRANNSVNNATSNVSMRALKFSIDNILKPDFGRQTTPIYNIPNLKKGSSGGALLSVRSSSGVGLQNASTGMTSTSKKNSVTSSSNRKHCVSAEKVGSKNRSNACALPMDLSKVVSPVGSSADGRDSASAAREGPAAAATGGSSAGALPGSPQLLWPAWVYCTRYSDRPSSGKS
jgi:hypothetical protein